MLIQGGAKQLKKATQKVTQQPKKAASKAASPLKKVVPKSSVGTKRIGKRSAGGSGSGGEEKHFCTSTLSLRRPTGLHTAIYIGAWEGASTPDHILGANRGND